MTSFETDIAAMLPSPGAGQSLDAWSLSDEDGNGNFPTYVGGTNAFQPNGDPDPSGGPGIVAGEPRGAAAGGDDAGSFLALVDAGFNPVIYPQTNNFSFGIWISPNATNQFARLVVNGTPGTNGWAILQSDGNGAAGNQISLEYMGVTQNVCGTFSVTPGVIPYYIVIEIASDRTATLKYQAGISGGLVTAGSSSAFTMITPTGQTLALSDLTTAYNGTIAESWMMVGNLPTDTQLNTQFADGAIQPTVNSHTPASGATGVSTGAVLTATFSRPINPGTLVLSLADASGNIYATTVVFNPFTNIATWTPITGLKGGTVYTASLTAAIGVDGVAMPSATTWSFTTIAAVTPVVSSKTPAAGDGYVSIGAFVTATFNENINATTLNFTLVGPGSSVIPVALKYDPTTFTATWTPIAPLAALTAYTATINSVSDLAGNALASPVSWSFTTTTAPDTSKPEMTWRYTHRKGWESTPFRAFATADANTLGLWNFSNFGSNASADLSANAYSCSFPNGATLVGNIYFPASNAPKLNGTTQFGSIATLLNTMPTQWSISVGFIVNSAPSANARIFQKTCGSGDSFDWFFNGGNPGTIQINTTGNGTTDSFTTVPVDLLDSKQHTITQTFDGTNLHSWLDGISLNIVAAASPQSGGSGILSLGANTSGANPSPLTLQLFEVTPRALNQAEIERRHQQWAGPQNTTASRLQLQTTVTFPQYNNALQECTILYKNGVYDIFATAGYSNQRTVRITSTDGKNWSDAGTALGGGFGGENIISQPFAFQDADGSRYLYYSPAGSAGLYVATTTDDHTFTRHGLVAAVTTHTTGLTDGAVVSFNGTYYLLIACSGPDGYVGVWQTFVFTATNPLGPFTVQNGGLPLQSLDPMQGGISGGGTIFPRKVNGVWHTWFHGPTAPNSYASTQIFHYVNDSLIADTWQPFTDTPEFPLDVVGFDQLANPSITFDGKNIFFVLTRLNNTGHLGSLAIYSAPMTTPEQLLGPDPVVGMAGGQKGSRVLTRSR